MSFHILFILIISLLHQPCLSYVSPEFGQPADTHSNIPYIPIPRPYRLPPDEAMRYDPLPSMITAIAPSATMVDNGTYETMWSMHYHSSFTKRRQGVGIFQRGVFANDPPIATCTPCGYQGTGLTTNSNITTPPATATCTTHTYLGVFRSKVGSLGTSTASYCYDTVYSGVFVSVTTSSTGLPCCFTIPASCFPHNSSSTSYTYSSGVFRPNSVSSNATTTSSRSSTSSSSSSSPRASTILSTTSSSSQSSVASSSSRTSTITVVVSTIPGSLVSSASSTTSAAFGSSGTSRSKATSSSSSEQTSTSTSFDPGQSTSASNVIISNDGPRPGSANPPVTLSVVTIQPTTTAAPPTPYTKTVNNTIYGCGTASGSGVINGTGTVYVYPLGIPVVSSGVVSGYAPKVVGCGTLYATTGTFSGSATIVACGYGSGSGTIMGSGTVYPAMLGGMIPVVSSGTVTGSGAVTGCGTIIGSGTFTATEGYITTITPAAGTVRSTVEVYISSCTSPDDGVGMGMPRIVGNMTVDGDDGKGVEPTSSALLSSNGTLPAGNATDGGATSIDNPLCHVCDNDVGTCCPLSSACGDDGHCPWNVLQNAGYALQGLYNVVMMKNSSGVAKRGIQAPEQVATIFGW